MSTPSYAEKQDFIDLEKELNKDRIHHLIGPTKHRFQKILKSYAAFNVFFFFLISFELIYLFIHLTFLVQNFVLAIHLALIFASFFSYFTLRLFFQIKKTEKCIDLKNEFIESVKKNSQFQEDSLDYYLDLATMCCKLATHLHRIEYFVYRAPFQIDLFTSPLEKFSCWCHWQDAQHLKELFLQESIKFHIRMVQIEPTKLDVHVGLANAYVMLSGLYIDPRTVEGLDEDLWIPSNKYKDCFEKFKLASERAIEEFKIISDFAPHDPWVHAQLAFSYHDLNMPEEEIKEYETILQLCPDDKETLFKLGRLYFEQGMNAKGLRIYEILKKSHYKKAEALIQFYGHYTSISSQKERSSEID